MSQVLIKNLKNHNLKTFFLILKNKNICFLKIKFFFLISPWGIPGYATAQLRSLYFLVGTKSEHEARSVSARHQIAEGESLPTFGIAKPDPWAPTPDCN